MLLRLKKAAVSALQDHLVVTIDSWQDGPEKEFHMLRITLTVVAALGIPCAIAAMGP